MLPTLKVPSGSVNFVCMRTPARPLALCCSSRSRSLCRRADLAHARHRVAQSSLPPFSSPGLVKVRPRRERPRTMHAAFACRREARLCPRAHPSTPSPNPFTHACLSTALAVCIDPRRLGLSCCARPTSCSVCTTSWQALAWRHPAAARARTRSRAVAATAATAAASAAAIVAAVGVGCGKRARGQR